MKLHKILILILLVRCIANNTENVESQENKAEKNNKEVVCFLYHRFGDSRHPSTNISLQDFEAHLNYLKTNGFTVLTLSKAIDYLKSDQTLKKVAVLTIDDGFNSFYNNAVPLLKKYGFPATLFINTETVGSADYMGWAEIKKVHEQGIEIGNHTHSHAYFLNQPETERYETFEREIRQTQKLITENIGAVPKTFAYPFGELDPKMKAIVKNMGFEAAGAQNSGVIYYGTDLMQCPRFPMNESYSALDQFAMKAETKALKIVNKIPASFVLPKGENQPDLTITIQPDELKLDQLQCFIQGSECETRQTINTDSTVTLTLKATSSIADRRRTLYTITVPDENGKWHWFSHLWINPEIK
ncbi:MAG: polysaccharide deacetylase family protein [Bacteroidota bacterium]